jgi:hypothetical protein
VFAAQLARVTHNSCSNPESPHDRPPAKRPFVSIDGHAGRPHEALRRIPQPAPMLLSETATCLMELPPASHPSTNHGSPELFPPASVLWTYYVSHAGVAGIVGPAAGTTVCRTVWTLTALGMHQSEADARSHYLSGASPARGTSLSASASLSKGTNLCQLSGSAG